MKTLITALISAFAIVGSASAGVYDMRGGGSTGGVFDLRGPNAGFGSAYTDSSVMKFEAMESDPTQVEALDVFELRGPNHIEGDGNIQKTREIDLDDGLNVFRLRGPNASY